MHSASPLSTAAASMGALNTSLGLLTALDSP